MAKKILLGLTTISGEQWRNKVEEIDELGIKEVALFPTSLNTRTRQELYRLLEKTKLKEIPHVHLRNDMEVGELDYLTNRFKTKVFNIHSAGSPYASLLDYKQYCRNIYIENTGRYLPTSDDLTKYGGLCLDLSHWQDVVLAKDKGSRADQELKKIAARYKIGCNHISAVKREKHVVHDRFINKDFISYSSHHLDNLSEVDYVKKYRNYLSDIISIELENTLKRQLEVKRYLENILDL